MTYLYWDHLRVENMAAVPRFLLPYDNILIGDPVRPGFTSEIQHRRRKNCSSPNLGGYALHVTAPDARLRAHIWSLTSEALSQAVGPTAADCFSTGCEAASFISPAWEPTARSLQRPRAWALAGRIT